MDAAARASRRMALLLAAATVLTVSAAAQEGGTLPPGPIYLTDTLTVEAGEVLSVGPGTSITGPGSIVVAGRFVVNGTSEAPVEFSVPIRVVGGGEAVLQHARVWGVNGTALELSQGEARLEDVLFEGNARGASVSGESLLHATRVSWRDHEGEGLYVAGTADVRLDASEFAANGRGVTLYSAQRFVLNASAFRENGQHLVVDLGPWSADAPELRLVDNRFAASPATPARLPSILLRYDAPLVGQGATRAVTLESNRIEGAAVGLRAEGRGLVVDSRNDTFVDNEVGLSVQLATVRLSGATLGNARDVEGSGRVTLEDVTYLRAASPPPEPSAAPAAWAWWILGGAGALLLAAVALGPRLRRLRARAVEPLPPPEPAPAAAPAPPAPDLAVPVTALERRILEDILAHPGTAQRAVADRLGYTRQALHYHVKKLEARGLVVKTLEGRETRCTVPPAVASMLQAAPTTRTGSQEKA